jgi:phosphonate transport system ATP-binding protein
VPYARAYADRVVGLSQGRVAFDVPTGRFDRTAFEELYGDCGADRAD